MKNKKIIGIIVVAFIVLIGGATILYNNLKDSVDNNQLAATGGEENTDKNAAEKGEEVSSKAPDFTVYDKDGKEVHLSDFVGKPVIINFWATWCGYCVQEMPDFEEKFKEYGDQIHFMMINVTDGYQETLESTKSYISEYKYSFPVYYDTKLSASLAYGAYSLPCTFFIDADGNLDSHILGMIPKETLQAGIDRLLK